MAMNQQLTYYYRTKNITSFFGGGNYTEYRLECKPGRFDMTELTLGCVLAAFVLYVHLYFYDNNCVCWAHRE